MPTTTEAMEEQEAPLYLERHTAPRGLFREARAPGPAAFLPEPAAPSVLLAPVAFPILASRGTHLEGPRLHWRGGLAPHSPSTHAHRTSPGLLTRMRCWFMAQFMAKFMAKVVVQRLRTPDPRATGPALANSRQSATRRSHVGSDSWLPR